MVRLRMTRTSFPLAVAVATFFLVGCGNSAEKQSEVTQQTKATAPAVVAKEAGDQEQPSSRETQEHTTEIESAPPQQISETGDGSESIEDPSTAKSGNATLKLASNAKAEPKPAPSKFKEGVHYQRLVPTQPTNVSPDQVEVVEVFWYGCPHCFAIDPKIEAWRKKDKASYVTFTRIPAVWNDVALFHARVFYTAELLGKTEELHTPIFREIHVNGNMLNTMDKVKAFFTSRGVSQGDFDGAFARMAIETKLQEAGIATRRYHITGVPTFIVNGKYTLDVPSAGGEEQVLQLISELAAREHGG